MQTNDIQIAPSLLSADPLHMGKELADIESCGADLHHVDVMDGHFVPNLTYGPPLVMALKSFCKIPLDVHIMVSNPDDVALDYVKAGADILTFHAEAARDPRQICSAIRAAGCQAGIAVSPDTPVSTITSLLDTVDQVLIMSVHPGFGGQSFIESSLTKITELAAALKDQGREDTVRIEVDGGINDKNVGQVIKAGVTRIVAGSYVYKSKDRRAAIASLRQV